MTHSVRPSWTPPLSDGGDGQSRIVGFDVTCSVDMDLPALRWYQDPGGHGPTSLVPVLFLTGTQTVVAQGSPTTPAATGWIPVPFDATQTMTGGVTYTWAIKLNAGSLYFANTDLSAPITDPDLGLVTALAHTGRFINDVSSVVWPGEGSGDYQHGVDGLFDLASTPVAGTDTATLTDTSSVTAAIASTDTATLTDTSTVTAAAAGTDTGTGSESSAVTAAVPRTDTATLTETASVAKMGPPGAADLDLEFGPPAAGWTFGAPRTGWTAGAPRRTV